MSNNVKTQSNWDTYDVRVNLKLDPKHWTAAVDAAQALNLLRRLLQQLLWTDVETKNVTVALNIDNVRWWRERLISLNFTIIPN